jgi:hypothetical protein
MRLGRRASLIFVGTRRIPLKVSRMLRTARHCPEVCDTARVLRFFYL